MWFKIKIEMRRLGTAGPDPINLHPLGTSLLSRQRTKGMMNQRDLSSNPNPKRESLHGDYFWLIKLS